MSLSVDRAILKTKVHAKKGEVDLAEKIYMGVLEKFPNNKRAIESLRSLHNLKSPHISSNSAPSQDQINALIALYNQGQLEGVVKQANSLAEQFPQAIILFKLLGAANAGLRRLDAAIESHNRAVRIKPDYAEGHNNLGVALQENADLIAAIERYNCALQIKPDFAEAHNNLGSVLREKGDLTAAIKSSNRALQIKPDYEEAHYNLGSALKEHGDLEAAIESFNRALQIKPDFAEAHNN